MFFLNDRKLKEGIIMSVQILKKEVPSTDGIHMLRGKLYLPEEPVRAVVQISHGMIEHIGRYEPFMTFLAEHGFAVCGHDHIGHGATAEKGEFGYFADQDGWKTVIRDLRAFGAAVMREFPDSPHVLLGHSMGSFIARNAVSRYPDEFDALIMMGTGGPNPASDIGLFLTSLIKCFKGGKYNSKLVEKAAFSTYNRRTGSDNPCAWLTHDEKMLAAHDADEYCRFQFTVSAMHDLVKLQKEANLGRWFRSIKKEMPILLVSGEEDPVGAYGRGVKKIYKKLKDAGVRDVTLILYPEMRHEILNEKGREKVFADLLNWIGSKV